MHSRQMAGVWCAAVELCQMVSVCCCHMQQQLFVSLRSYPPLDPTQQARNGKTYQFRSITFDLLAALVYFSQGRQSLKLFGLASAKVGGTAIVAVQLQPAMQFTKTTLKLKLFIFCFVFVYFLLIVIICELKALTG